MKNKIFRLSIITLLIVIDALTSISNLNAQWALECSNLKCPENQTPWVSGILIKSINSQPPCTIEVLYKTRIYRCEPNDPLEFEYELLGIKTTGTCNFTNEELFNYAHEMILIQAFSETGLNYLPFVYERRTIHLYQPSCWIVEDDLTPFTTDRRPYCSTLCCEFYYTIYFDENYDLYLEDVQNTSLPVECDALIGCFYTCDWELSPEFLENVGYLMPRIRSENNANLVNDEKSSIIPNPSSGVLEIIFTSPIMGAFSLKLTDVLGNTVKELTFSKNTDKCIIPLDLTNNSNGLYYFIIHNDVQKFSDGSLIISK